MFTGMEMYAIVELRGCGLRITVLNVYVVNCLCSVGYEVLSILLKRKGTKYTNIHIWREFRSYNQVGIASSFT